MRRLSGLQPRESLESAGLTDNAAALTGPATGAHSKRAGGTTASAFTGIQVRKDKVSELSKIEMFLYSGMFVLYRNGKWSE